MKTVDKLELHRADGDAQVWLLPVRYSAGFGTSRMQEEEEELHP